MVVVKRTENFYYGASDEIIKRARILRKTMTKSELKLWNHLNKKQINNIRFRRQHPIAKFIVDFYCHPLKLVIEIDGSGYSGANCTPHSGTNCTPDSGANCTPDSGANCTGHSGANCTPYSGAN